MDYQKDPERSTSREMIELLLRGAKVTGAGRTLGMTDDQTLKLLQQQSIRRAEPQ